LMLSACEKNDSGYYQYENQENSFQGSTYEYLASKTGVYDSLLKAVDRVDWIQQALQGDSLTLFALTNNSFRTALQNLNLIRSNQGKAPLELNTVDIVELDSLLSKYLAHGYYPTDSLLYIDGA